MDNLINIFVNNYIIPIISAIFVSGTILAAKKLWHINFFDILLAFPSQLRHTGLRSSFKNFNAALPAIKKSLKKSKTARILSNRGNEWFGSDTAPLSKEIEERNGSSLKLQICLLDNSSAWLKKRWSNQNDSNALRDFFVSTQFTVEAFVNKNQQVLTPKSGVFYHNETPCWKMLITDDSLFISSYAGNKNVRDETVLLFRGPNTPFYDAAVRYFDSIYKNDKT